jgi:lipid II:glycine glycyltransferase (peptidoglycan interpeptide bridge formation enzyme)
VDGHRGGRVSLIPERDELLMGLRQKWRNCLYKAERLGTRVTASHEQDAFDRFISEYARMLNNASFRKTTTPKLLNGLQDALPRDGKMVVFEAWREGQPISWALFAHYSGLGEYLGYVSHPVGRSLNCGQLLVWNAMLYFKRKGFHTLDVGGYDAEHATSGVSRFKAGLNATPYHLCDEIDAAPKYLPRALIRGAVLLHRRPYKFDIRRSIFPDRSPSRASRS